MHCHGDPLVLQERRHFWGNIEIYCSRVVYWSWKSAAGSRLEMLSMMLQNGQDVLSHPHWGRRGKSLLVFRMIFLKKGKRRDFNCDLLSTSKIRFSLTN